MMGLARFVLFPQIISLVWEERNEALLCPSCCFLRGGGVSAPPPPRFAPEQVIKTAISVVPIDRICHDGLYTVYLSADHFDTYSGADQVPSKGGGGVPNLYYTVYWGKAETIRGVTEKF